MIISRLNRLFERHRRVAWLVIALVIIIPFVFFVGPGRRGSGSGKRKGPEIGEMYGKPIDSDEFYQKLYAADISMFLRWGQFPSENQRLFPFLLRETLRRIRGVREAEKMGLDQISDQQVAEAIREVPMFQDGGTFSVEAFNRFRENTLKRRDIDGAGFDRLMRETIMVERLEASVRAGALVAPAEVRDEFDRTNEKFVIKYLEFNNSELIKQPDIGPTEEEIETYYSENRDELRLPDQKRIRVAALTPELFTDNVNVGEKEVRDYYERNRKRMYDPKNQPFDDVKAEIEERLLRNKARGQAGTKARAIAAKLKEAQKDGKPENAAELFSTACKEQQVEPKDSGPFTEAGKIPEIGDYGQLRQKAYALTPEKPFSDVIYDSGTYFVAGLLTVTPGEKPSTLTEWVRNDVSERILDERAQTFYREHVEAYREDVDSGKTPELLKSAYADEVNAVEDKTDEEKQKLIADHEQAIEDNVEPYFVPERRRARVLTFSPGQFRTQVKLTDEDLKAYYDSHQEVYNKEEVRARHILMRLPPKATDEQKETKRQQLQDILKRIRAGEDFAQVARKHSEDPATKKRGGDMGFFSRDAKAPPLSAAAFGLEKGQVSDIVETPSGYHLVKAEDRRTGRPFEEVKVPIRRELTVQTAGELAVKAATEFAQKAADALAKAGDGSVAADVFAEAAKEAAATTKDTDWFQEKGAISPFGSQPALLEAAWGLNAGAPLSAVVKGQRDHYVACWLETQAGHLPTFEEDPGLAARVRGQQRREEARAWYEEHVEPFRDGLSSGKAPNDLISDYESGLAADDQKTDGEKQELREEYRKRVGDYLRPYYVPEQKRSRVAVFAVNVYRPMASATDEKIQAHYDDNLSKYQKEEVRVRQILLTFAKDADDARKKEVAATLEAIRQKIRGGTDFAELATQLSEDAASKKKGGDLGFFARGSKAKEMEESAFSLELGQVSDVVQTDMGCHLLKLEDKRDQQPLEEVRDEIKEELIKKEAERIAQDQANEFADKLYQAFEDTTENDVPGDIFSNVADKNKVVTRDTGWHRGFGSMPPFGFKERDLSRETYKLSKLDPLSGVIKGTEDYFVACWLGTQPAYLPSFDDERGLSGRVEGQVKREKATRIARQRAQAARDRISAALQDGKPFEEACGKLEFMESEEFPRNRPPAGVPSGRDIAESAAEIVPGTLLEPVETPNGAVLAALVSRKLPSDDEFKEEQESVANRLRGQKEGALIRKFYERLKQESNTQLNERWQVDE